MSADVNKMKEVVDNLKEDLGEGLLSCEIWSDQDGEGIVGINPHPAACALFNELAKKLRKTIKDSELASLGNFYVLDLGPDVFSMTIFAGGYQLGFLLDKHKTSIGLLMSVAYPRAHSGLLEATGGK